MNNNVSATGNHSDYVSDTSGASFSSANMEHSLSGKFFRFSIRDISKLFLKRKAALIALCFVIICSICRYCCESAYWYSVERSAESFMISEREKHFAKAEECVKLHDYKNAFKFYKMASDEGSAEAARRIGNFYDLGLGCDMSSERALHYYKLAADRGDVACMHITALRYRRYFAIDNFEKSMVYLKKAAEAGNAESQYMLGKIYAGGSKIEPDSAKALYWLEKACENDCGEAQLFLGKCYMSGEKNADANPFGANYSGIMIVGADYAKGLELLIKASEKNVPGAKTQLGIAYLSGKGVEHNAFKATQLISVDAEAGVLDSQILLAKCYMKGVGVQQYFPRCAFWFRRASEQGSAEAQNYLGKMYRDGVGVEKSMTEALRWWKEAANQGNAEAQYNYGSCLCRGEGCDKNPETGLTYLKLAAKQGHSQAVAWLTSLGYESKHWQAPLRL